MWSRSGRRTRCVGNGKAIGVLNKHGEHERYLAWKSETGLMLDAEQIKSVFNKLKWDVMTSGGRIN